MCNNCEAFHGEENQLYGDLNDIRQCKQCRLIMCTNCKWFEACSSCDSQVCGECMKEHHDACSGSRARRNREEAIRRKKVKEAEDNKAKTVKEGGTTAAASLPPPEQPRDRKSCDFHVSKAGSSTDMPGHEETGDQPKQHIGSRADVLIGKYGIKRADHWHQC